MINSLSLRSNYKTLKKFTYLNQASLGLVSEKTATSMIEFLNEIAKHGNAHMSDQEEVNFFQTLRNTCCRLFNCNSRNRAIMSSASELLNQLPYLLDLKKGSKVVLVKSDFPALFRPWQAFSEKNKLKTHFVDENLNIDLTSSILISETFLLEIFCSIFLASDIQGEQPVFNLFKLIFFFIVRPIYL